MSNSCFVFDKILWVDIVINIRLEMAKFPKFYYKNKLTPCYLLLIACCDLPLTSVWQAMFVLCVNTYYDPQWEL